MSKQLVLVVVAVVARTRGLQAVAAVPLCCCTCGIMLVAGTALGNLLLSVTSFADKAWLQEAVTYSRPAQDAWLGAAGRLWCCA